MARKNNAAKRSIPIKRSIPWGFIATLVTLCFAAILAYTYLNPATEHTQGTAQGTTQGDVPIGGAFELVTHKGENITDQAFRGKYMLMYFGYSFCPDVCPVELQNMATALDMIDAKTLDRIAPLFITIDPERDTVDAMAQYVSLFHPRLIGLTGTPEQIRTAAGAWRVYYQKATDQDSSAEYLMDHSSIIFLMDPEGRYVSHFSYGTAPEQIAQKLGKIIN
ncbi:MAG: SCO family protein [Kordiimonas sp.]|nr:SCO family protein [Kordiimonas sp.]|tara:strand:+ start:1796 stop:2458 length:663 start_codon:yes stop_codon:yes gene_type:complete